MARLFELRAGRTAVFGLDQGDKPCRDLVEIKK